MCGSNICNIKGLICKINFKGAFSQIYVAHAQTESNEHIKSLVNILVLVSQTVSYPNFHNDKDSGQIFAFFQLISMCIRDPGLKGKLRSKKSLAQMKERKNAKNEPSLTSMRKMVLEISHFKVRNWSKIDVAIL